MFVFWKSIDATRKRRCYAAQRPSPIQPSAVRQSRRRKPGNFPPTFFFLSLSDAYTSTLTNPFTLCPQSPQSQPVPSVDITASPPHE